jgi:uncharacterized membrane protein YfhO
MLNTKYVIYNPDAPPLFNKYAYGHAWFAPGYVYVGSADEEIDALAKYNLKDTVVVDKRFEDVLDDKKFEPDLTADIKLESYAPNYLKYSYNAGKEQMLVFSEIYYDKGWKAFLNGEEVPYFRVNYVLRAMVVPAGKGTIEWKFEPKIWAIGEKISFISSLILILLLAAGIWMEIKKKKPVNQQPETNSK